MKKAVENIVAKRWPEIPNRMHLPLWAVVTAVSDPPTGGENCTAERPFYAVDVQLLKDDGSADLDMPTLRDIPVAMTGAAPGRGFATLPQPGTIVELAFAFGRQDKPFIRSVMPYNLPLPAIDALSQRWQQTPASFQQADAAGNWTRETNLTITDRAAVEISTVAPKHWIGSDSDNLLQIVVDFMATVIATFEILAAHTHKLGADRTQTPEQANGISGGVGEATTEKGRLELIKK